MAFTSRAHAMAEQANSGGRSEPRRSRIEPPTFVLGRVGLSIAEAAASLGVRSDALRRLVERHACAEGNEIVARLSGGIVARKRNGLGRWLVVIPSELRA